MKSRVKGAVFFCMMAALAGAYSVIDKNHAVYDEKELIIKSEFGEFKY